MIKRITAFLLFAVAMTISSKAQTNIDIRAWQLHHPDMDYCKGVMDKAREYKINTIVLSHGIIGNTMQLYGTSARDHQDKLRSRKIKELVEYGKSKNLKVWIWTHELADVPEKFLLDGVVQMDKNGFWKWLEDRYDEVFRDYPEIDGFMLTFHETQFKIFSDTEVHSKLSKPDRFQNMINTIYKSCKKHNKDLIVRTFVYEPDQLEWLKEGLSKTNKEVMVQSKCVPHDWEPFYPDNPVIGKFPGRKQIIEFDCSSEYTGKNHIPYTSPHYFLSRWKYDRQFPEVAGYNLRLDHNGYDALSTPNEVNIYTFYRATENPEITAGEIWKEWAEERYGKEAAPYVIEALKPSFEIVNRLFFPQGVWFTNHSLLPTSYYATKHIPFITKWDPEDYTLVTASMLNPGQEMYQKILSEKDSAQLLLVSALWQLNQGRNFLRRTDYYDLLDRLLLLNRVSEIWRLHAEGFFALLMMEDHPEMKPVVERVVENLKMIADAIPEELDSKPVLSRSNILKVAADLEKRISAFQNSGNKVPGISLKRTGWVQHKASPVIKASYWGIQAGSTSDSILEKASQLGVKWTRLQAKWEQIERKKGIYDWSKTDQVFSAVLKYGITPFVTLGNGNAIYSGTGVYDDPKLAAIYGSSPAPPTVNDESMDAWLNFVSAVVTRYKDRIIYWEIWNEPNHRKFWGSTPNGNDYGRLVLATAKRIRQLQPGAKIIAGATAGMDKNFADQFLSACDPDNLDMISFHHYSTLPEDRVYNFTGFNEVITKHNPELEIWQGECGYPSQSRTTGYRGKAPWGLNIQAKWLLRQSFVDSYFCHATLSNYFILFSDGTTDPEKRSAPLTGIDSIFGYPERNGSRVYAEGVNQKSILFRKNAQPKPAYKAYQNLCAVFDDEYKVFTTDYDINVLDQGVFYGIGEHEDAFPSVPLMTGYKTDENKSLIAYWLPWNPQEYLPEFATVKISVEGHRFADPVLIDPLDGSVYDINDFETIGNRTIFDELPLADYPFIIIDREKLNE